MKNALTFVALAMIIAILWDAFEVIVLPRRVTRRFKLTRLFYRLAWLPFLAIAPRMRSQRRREALLSFFGPLSLILLLIVWAIGLIVGFALLHWSLGSQLNVASETLRFKSYFYMSGVTFFTLGFGDLVPTGSPARAIAVWEAGTGFGFLAIIIGYLPVIYQSFSRREVNISMLDARAGSPPTAVELLRRHSGDGEMAELHQLLRDWERWSADLLESHLSYPFLCFYRSQHTNQSWIAALTAILDTCALLMVGIRDGPSKQARLTFAMARHAVVDLAQIFSGEPLQTECDRLSPETLAAVTASLSEAGMPLRGGESIGEELAALRRKYEPYLEVLADYLLMELPPWLPDSQAADNWQVTAWDRTTGRLTPSVFRDRDGKHY